jgi:hypothetical protein
MGTSLSPGCAVARWAMTMTDTHAPDAPAVAWEYTGRDGAPFAVALTRASKCLSSTSAE